MNFIKIIKFDFMQIIRNPMLLIMNTLFVLILFGGFGLVTNSNFGSENISSYDYYSVQTLIMSGILVSMTVSNIFVEESVKRANIRIVYSPISKTEIYLSKLIATYIFSTISYCIICLIDQYVFHSNLGGKNIIYIILLINILSLLGCALGTLACCIFKNEERANAVIPIIVCLFIYLGGTFSPVGHFGKLMKTIACISPLNWVSECAFRIIYDNDFSIYLPIIFVLIFVSVIFIIICQVTFKPEEYI